MVKNLKFGPKLMLLAGFLASSIVVSTAFTQAAPEKGKPAAVRAPGPSPSAATMRVHPFATSELNGKAKRYYQHIWGVDILGVKLVSSGLMLRFSYRVLDANKAQTLNDKKATPLLIDQKTGAQLVVPTMEKVGQLRQSSRPENGREYWMLFSNKGNLVKAGSRVDVVIGNFRAKGLMVQSK